MSLVILEFGDPIDKFDAFYIDVYEVTVGRVKEFLKSSGYKPDKPINWVELY
jgi:formylglycine-generating enzyme required for sulfatase activity